MSRTIRVDPEVLRHIERHRRDGESVDSVLRRLLGLEPSLLSYVRRVSKPTAQVCLIPDCGCTGAPHP